MSAHLPSRLSSLIRSRRAALAALFILPTMLAVLALWLPFGFGMAGHIEEWGMLGLFEKHGALPVAWWDGPMGLHAVRPLVPLMFYLSYALSPDSFVGWHLVLIGALLLKGAAASYLAYKGTGSARVAAWFGPLVLLYPADTMQLSFRSQHINWAMALALLSGALLLFAFGRARRSARLGWSALGALLLALAAGMYEAALTLAPLPFLMLLVEGGPRALWDSARRHWDAWLVWGSGALAYVGFALWVSSRIASYQSSIAGGGRSVLAVLRESLPKLFSVGYLRALIGGWVDAAGMIATEFASVAYLLAASLAVAAALLLLVRRAAPALPERVAVAVRLLPLGLLSCALGYAPFLLLPTHQVISQRTFLWASPGAAMVLLGLLMLLSRLSRPLMAAAATGLLTLGLGAQMFQFHHYVQLAGIEKALLRAIVSQTGPDFQGKTLVIRDQTNLLGHTWTFPGNLPMALTYLYGREPGPLEICHEPSHEWVHADSLARRGRCSDDASGWTFTPAAPVSGPGFTYADRDAPLHVAADKVLVLTIHPDFSASLTGGPAAVPTPLTQRRMQGALAPDSGVWPLFKDQQPGPTYRWSFGDWWSLEQPTRGSGWREAEWNGEGLVHHSLAWKVAPRASIDFHLQPLAARYRLEGQFGAFASPAVRAGVVVLLNGQRVPMALAPDGRFSAAVDPAWLRAGLNEFAVEAPVDDAYYGLSLQLDWFAVRPE